LPSSGRMSGVLGDYPRHEFIDLAGWMTVGDFGQHICEVGLRIDAVELGGLQDGDQGGGALPALITAGEQPVAAPEGNRGVILPMSGSS